MSDTPKKPLFLVDGSSFLYRAFHALPALTTSQGLPTGAIFGVANMLRKILKDYDPDYMAVIFDAKGKTFRDDLYPEYKATRPPMPTDLQKQIEPLHALVKAMGLPLLCVEGVEADDVLGTLALQAQQAGMQTIIASSDKDLSQLVNEDITLVNTMTDKILDTAGVEEKFGIPPSGIIDYLSLVGDSVDNVPGIPNVGPKTAAKWLQHYGSVKNIIAHADEIKGKVGDNLRANLDALTLSQTLVTVKCDVTLDYTPTDLTLQPPDQKQLIALVSEFEFKGWLSELLGKPSHEAKPKSYDLILTEQALTTWVKKLKAAKYFAFDTETTSLNYMQAKLVGFSFSTTPGEAAYLPFGHTYEGAPQQLPIDVVLKHFKPLLESEKYLKVGQHIKYDMNVLSRYDIHLKGIAFDTMLESYVLDSTATRHDMDSLALKYLSHRTIHFEDVAGRGAKQLTFDQVPLEQASDYAAEDADITLQLHETLWPTLNKQPGLKGIFETIELPLLSILSRMETHGVLIDTTALKKQSETLKKRLTVLEEKTYALAGEVFNLGSTKQLQAILYEKLGLPILKKTPKGQPSTAEPVLQELAINYPLPKLILEYRSLSKLKSTYTDKLPEVVDPITHRVHTSYHQAVAATGRLSSSDPNLQNIPVRTEEGRRIRQAFIVPPGYKMIAADYSQIELRLMAHLAQDAGLLKAFKNGWDVHSATAAEVFGVELEAVTPAQRRDAKVINFGLMYGMSAFGLSRQLGVDRHAAQAYIDMYFERYPGVKNYMESTRKLAHDQGYVETLLGRRLTLPDINASNQQRQKAAERAAINGPLQGTAADLIKLAMINTETRLQQSHLDVTMIMQVHDELVFEAAESDVDAAVEIILASMNEPMKLDVHIVTEIGVGNNWDEAH